MNKNEEVTLQERLDALEYETGSRMDMFDSAIRNAGGFDQPEEWVEQPEEWVEQPAEVTFTDKLKQAGKWMANHKEELLVASVTVVTGAVIYALYKSQKRETTTEVPEAIGKMVPIKQFLSTVDNHRWGLVMHKYDGDGNEVTVSDVIEQLTNGDYNQVDDNLIIFEEDDDNENR